MEGHDETQDTESSQDYTGWTDTSGDYADNLDLWDDLAREEAARHVVLPQSAQEQPEPMQGCIISMLGGLSMCELSVGDERQQDEHEERK